MPDGDGRFKGISVPKVPWHEYTVPEDQINEQSYQVCPVCGRPKFAHPTRECDAED